MKLINIYKYLVLVVIAVALTVTTYSQDSGNDKGPEIQNLLKSKNFVFLAQQALPMTGRSINLTSLYSLTVKGDTVKSDLPYFGRAYVAPLNPAEGGIRFTSVENDFKAEQKKKGRVDITISLKEPGDVRRLFLSVTKSGYATLLVQSNNRQPISFNGYITVKENVK
jgi:hypothetical protein